MDNNRLAMLRLQRNLSQKDMAKMLGLTQQAYCNYEKGRRQVPDEIKSKLADIYHVSIDFLMGRTVGENYESQYGSHSISPVSELVAFDELGTVRGGFDGMLDEIPTGRKIEIPRSELHGRPDTDFFTLRVKGNSMYPKIIDGDTILCERCDSVDSGTYAVVLYNGDEATVKKVRYVYGEDWLELIPENPEYMPRRIEGADIQLCRIIGKVIRLIRNF